MFYVKTNMHSGRFRGGTPTVTILYMLTAVAGDDSQLWKKDVFRHATQLSTSCSEHLRSGTLPDLSFDILLRHLEWNKTFQSWFMPGSDLLMFVFSWWQIEQSQGFNFLAGNLPMLHLGPMLEFVQSDPRFSEHHMIIHLHILRFHCSIM